MNRVVTRGAYRPPAAVWQAALVVLLWPVLTFADSPANPEPYELVAGAEDEYLFVMLPGLCVSTARDLEVSPSASAEPRNRIKTCPKDKGAEPMTDACAAYDSALGTRNGEARGRRTPAWGWSYETGFANRQGEVYPASGLYANDSSTVPLWTVDWYAFGVRVSANGRHLVRMGPWASSPDDLAVAFYEEGCLLKSYAIKKLVRNLDALQHTISHFFWRRQVDFDDARNLLRIGTVDGGTFLFDITTGEIVDANPSEAM